MCAGARGIYPEAAYFPGVSGVVELGVGVRGEPDPWGTVAGTAAGTVAGTTGAGGVAGCGTIS